MKNIFGLILISVIFFSFSLVSATINLGGCTETDEGLDYFTKGDCIAPDGDEYIDECYSDTKVQEYSCISIYHDGNYDCAPTRHTCDEGCLDGECISECVPDWYSPGWSGCIDGFEKTTYTDKNFCGTDEGKPLENRPCEGECVENWTCENWLECSEGIQKRNCEDTNNCFSAENRPETERDCSIPSDEESGEDNSEIVCVEDWSCTSWSSCINDWKGRDCEDSSSCNTFKDKPYETKSCSVNIGKERVFLYENTFGDIVLESDENRATIELDVTTESEKIFVEGLFGKKELIYSPSDAVLNIKKIDNISNMELKEDNEGKIIYEVTGTKKAMLFFIFPIKADVVEKIDMETGKVISRTKPWWHIFALGI